MPDERARLTERVIDRYRDKPFSWRSRAHCIVLAHDQGVALGHRLPPVPMFRTALGAKRALRKRGFASVTALLDSYFPRLSAPAFAIVGDLAVLRGEDDGRGLEAVCIADGLGNLFGWHPERPDGLAVIKQAQGDVIAAWRL